MGWPSPRTGLYGQKRQSSGLEHQWCGYQRSTIFRPSSTATASKAIPPLTPNKTSPT